MFTIYLEKKEGFRVQAQKTKRELETQLSFAIEEIRIIQMYYLQTELHDDIVKSIFWDPSYGEVSFSFDVPEGYQALRVEPQSGQFDQRAHWAQKCLQVYGVKDTVGAAVIYLVKEVDKQQWEAIRDRLINPVESREIALDAFPSRKKRSEKDRSFETFPLENADLSSLLKELDLALSVEDMEEVRKYFLEEGRAPNWSELKFLETFWSDHCRHTTFHTELESIDVSDSGIESAKEDLALYERMRKEWGNRPPTLMDLAVFSVRRQKKNGRLTDLEESEEINAASIYRKAGGEDILLMFKNETHNHPTEIEPFGGAATCLGGAIRDPLSGRSHVYQAMRLTGARDPRDMKTLEGKLPQMTLCRRAAEGYSSYGNQIGVATGCVQEFYHPGFEAKRMEAGFVIAAAKKSHVTRGTPEPGDLLLLLGGPTGRDGIGGASGSSKSHDESVVEDAASEVQKGNAPEERKLMRFFRDEHIGPKIIRCNDLGAGGVGVAFGEIAPGLCVELDHVPVKYEDIYPWEVLLSESQERMAVVIRSESLPLFEKTAQKENLTLTVIGKVTEEPRFVVTHQGKKVVDLSRDFLSSSGAVRKASAKAEPIDFSAYPYKGKNNDINTLRYASLQGLSEMFDSTAGALNVLAPFGGKEKKTPVEGMVSIIPIGDNREDVSIATWGYDPHLAQWSPYHGAQSAVLLSLLRALTLGSDIQGIRFTFQEYFERLGDDPLRWGKPLMALLGANSVLETFGLASIGGKDSMSGSYLWEGGELRVPPSLISFAVNTARLSDVISPEWKQTDSYLFLLTMPKNADYTFKMEEVKERAKAFLRIRNEGILSASVVESSLKETLLRSAFGNRIGATVRDVDDAYGSILIESQKELDHKELVLLGQTNDSNVLTFDGEDLPLDQALAAREAVLSDIYEKSTQKAEPGAFDQTNAPVEAVSKERVRVLLPIFPGTNDEDSVICAFEEAGAEVERWVFCDQEMDDAVNELAQRMETCDILALSGGYSSPGEPDASATFIACVFRQKPVREAFQALLDREGIVFGLNNGFQALLKMGVFHDGKIQDPQEVSMGLTDNAIGRHQAMYTSVQSRTDRGPWLAGAKEGDIYQVPVSMGEGRFFATEEDIRLLKERKQIATQYLENPSSSMENVEGLLSPCGKIIGRMAMDDRLQEGAGVNILQKKHLDIFSSAVAHMKGKK